MRRVDHWIRILAIRLAAAVLCAAASVAVAQGDDLLRYTVQENDTLIGLGDALLKDPAQWPMLQRINRVKNPRRIPVGTVLRIPADLLRKAPREAHIVFVSGAAQADGRAVDAGDRVSEGANLSTQADSFMTVELPDGSRLTLQPRSDVEIEALHGFVGFEASQRATFKVQRGRIETEVQPQQGPAARYRIRTPTAIIGVRGTNFRVAAEAEQTLAEMREGSVHVTGDSSGARITLNSGFGLVARTGQPLPPPVALLPPPGLSAVPSLHERPLLRFAVTPVEGAVGYRGQVALDADFSRIVAETRAALPDLRIDGLPDGDYFLRARAIDSQGLEGRDAQRPFRLKARPEPPFVSAPRPGGKANAGEVDFAWSKSQGAAAYRFMLARSADFSNPLVVEDAIAENAHRVALDEGTYFLRLASTRADGDLGPWGDPVSFTVRPPMAPVAAPTFDEDSMFFSWGGEPEQRFEYQLADDARFDSVIASGQVDEAEMTLPKPGAGAYYLRVRAIDPDGFVGNYSAPQQVVVPAQLPKWFWATPLLILLL